MDCHNLGHPNVGSASGNIHSANFKLIAFSERKEENRSCFLIIVEHFCCVFYAGPSFYAYEECDKGLSFLLQHHIS